MSFHRGCKDGARSEQPEWAGPAWLRVAAQGESTSFESPLSPLSTGSPRGCPPLPRPAHDLPLCGECVNGLRHGVGVRRAGFEAWACCHGPDLSPHILALQDKASVLSDVRVIIAEQLGTDVEKVCCFWQGGVVSLGRITEDSEGRMSLDEPSMQVIGNTL